MLMSLAVADTLAESPVKWDLTRNAQRELLEQQRRAARAATDRLMNLTQVADEVLEFDQLRRRLRDLLGDELGRQRLGDWRFFVSGRRQQLAAKEWFTEKEVTAVENKLRANLKRDERAYPTEAIELDPNIAWSWNSLGNLYCDCLHRFEDADVAFSKAIEFDETRMSAQLNRIFLQRDFLGNFEAGRHLMDALADDTSSNWRDTLLLHKALFFAYDQNWGLAARQLSRALDLLENGLPANTTDDWIRAAAVLLHLNYGRQLMVLLEQRGDDQKLRPF